MVTVVEPVPASERFTGGGRTMMIALGLGALGLVVTAALYLVNMGDPAASRGVLASYLTAFVYWIGIAIAMSIWLAIFHAAKARWPIVVRRPMETVGASIPVFVVLVIPILLGMGKLFSWVDPSAGHFDAEQLRLLAHKQPYLNPTFFTLRTLLYFVICGGAALLQWRWSVDQDETGSIENLKRMRTLGPASLPFLGLAITFAGFDWLMTLDPFWGSTVFGAYYFAGSFKCAMALLTLITVLSNRAGLFGRMVTKEHLHNLGKLMFAFTAFWAYIAFSQFMLIWIANIPEEGAWYLVRMKGEWQWVGIALVVCNFVLPFFFLLPRSTKMNRSTLAFAACWLLFFHLVDLHWIIRPAIGQAHFELGAFSQTVVAWVGVGGMAVAFGLWLAKGRHTVPIKDPFLADSLRYVQP